ncbi:MAG: hypothetical protein AVDCRST_MAG47-638, partial [uncultured Nocardioidaceae bacterium]
ASRRAAPARLRPPAHRLPRGPDQEPRRRRPAGTARLRAGARQPAAGRAGPPEPARGRPWRCRALRRLAARGHPRAAARSSDRLGGQPADRGARDQPAVARRPDQSRAAARL